MVHEDPDIKDEATQQNQTPSTQSSATSPFFELLRTQPHLCAKYKKQKFSSPDDLDTINTLLVNMKFIRQNPDMKRGKAKVKTEIVIPNIWKRNRWIRFTMKRFYFFLWTEQEMEQIVRFSDKLPTSLSTSSRRIYSKRPAVRRTARGAQDTDSEDSDYIDDEMISAPHNNDLTSSLDPRNIDCDDTIVDGQHNQQMPVSKKASKNESDRAKRKMKDALAELATFSSSSLYHPYSGFAPVSHGPKVRLSKREPPIIQLHPTTNALQHENDYSSYARNFDEDYENYEFDQFPPRPRSAVEAASAMEITEEVEMNEGSNLPAQQANPEAQPKRKRGRPRKSDR